MNLEKIQANAKRLGVTTDVYLYLRQSNRKFRYFVHDLKRETIRIESEKVTFIPSREDSLDRLKEDEGVEFAIEQRSVEDSVVNAVLLEQLNTALADLSEKERWLIQEIFYKEKSEEEIAEILGITQQAVNKQKRAMLRKLKTQLQV